MFTVIFALVAALVIGLLLPSQAKANPNAKGHLLFDDVDKVFRCLGSPTNCDFTATTEA